MKKVFIETNACNMVGYVFGDGMVAFDCETLGDALTIDDSGVVGCKSAEEAAANCNTEVYPFDEDRYENVTVISDDYVGDNDIPTRYVLGKTEIAISGTVEKIEGTAAEYNNWDLDEEIGIYDTYEEAKEQLKKYETKVTKGPELTYITEYIILEQAYEHGEWMWTGTADLSRVPEVYIVRSNDPDAEFNDLEEAKNYMIPDVDFDDDDYNEYIEELKNADTLEELAHIWNANTDRFNDGSSFDVKER